MTSYLPNTGSWPAQCDEFRNATARHCPPWIDSHVSCRASSIMRHFVHFSFVTNSAYHSSVLEHGEVASNTGKAFRNISRYLKGQVVTVDASLYSTASCMLTSTKYRCNSSTFTPFKAFKRVRLFSDSCNETSLGLQTGVHTAGDSQPPISSLISPKDG